MFDNSPSSSSSCSSEPPSRSSCRSPDSAASRLTVSCSFVRAVQQKWRSFTAAMAVSIMDDRVSSISTVSAALAYRSSRAICSPRYSAARRSARA
ncbi:hypothetical protein DQ04_10721030 [Trypanosoma grayi]|uniref:hypothetical protein n=1 Tax=Trypanosoma grayi TaxID=71804 RepID=UPI0004F43380|nr:hypothetical protein DQ04_10721030 [Trypanosoma grayi]KEG07158.1 hypothetical protein DQ04_10721030 [Trypanosoma grayi]